MIELSADTGLPTPLGEVAAWGASKPEAARHLRRAAYWHSLVAEYGLHVSEQRVDPGAPDRWLTVLDEHACAIVRAEIAEHGYLRWPSIVDADLCAALASAATALCRLGWDASFINMVDEVWHVCFHLAGIMTRVLGPSMLFRRELFAFCVDPSLAAGRSRGVQAHRDRPDSGCERFEGHVISRHCTCWISLTEADEANGCMYLVPTRADDEASLATPAVESERGHPLRTRPGDVLAWNGQAVHWGGRYDPARARSSRIAIAFSLTDARIQSIGNFAPVRADTLPAFPERLLLVATLLRSLNPPAQGSAMDAVLLLLGSRR